MEALQRNDYPDVNAGIKVAFDFSKPQGVEEYQMGKVGALEH
jgi:cold shock CspA family protein